jgi:hypothetical protein
MDRIERQDEDLEQLAERVLSWITYAVRPLSVVELQHALAVKFDATETDLIAIIDEDTLVSICAGLIM